MDDLAKDLTGEFLESLGFKKVGDGTWVIHDRGGVVECICYKNSIGWYTKLLVNKQAFCATGGETKRRDIVRLLELHNIPFCITAPPANAKPKTVRFRIAVAIDDEGRGCACGWRGTNNDSDSEKLCDVEIMMSHYDMETSAIHWVEVDIPVPVAPDPTTIEGTVTK